MAKCLQCDFPVDLEDTRWCPKCGSEVRRRRSGELLEIDICHSGESWEIAKDKIDRAVDTAFDRNFDGIRVVHGYGSTTGGRSVIAPQAVRYLRLVAEEEGGKYAKDLRNPGVSLVWLNR